MLSYLTFYNLLLNKRTQKEGEKSFLFSVPPSSQTKRRKGTISSSSRKNRWRTLQRSPLPYWTSVLDRSGFGRWICCGERPILAFFLFFFSFFFLLSLLLCLKFLSPFFIQGFGRRIFGG